MLAECGCGWIGSTTKMENPRVCPNCRGALTIRNTDEAFDHGDDCDCEEEEYED